MDDLLVNAYAHSNLHEALLIHLYADIIANNRNPQEAFYAFRNDVTRHLRAMVFPVNDQDTEKVRGEALASAARFFREVERILVSRGKPQPPE